jgi:hypothetical protein
VPCVRSTDFRTVRQLSKSFEPLAGYGARRLTFPERSLKRDGYQFTPTAGCYEGAAHVSRAAETKNPVEGEAAFASHLPLPKSKADNIHVAALSQPLPAALRQVRVGGCVKCERKRLLSGARAVLRASSAVIAQGCRLGRPTMWVSLRQERLHGMSTPAHTIHVQQCHNHGFVRGQPTGFVSSRTPVLGEEK